VTLVKRQYLDEKKDLTDDELRSCSGEHDKEGDIMDW
jgi:hypothetical protein